MSDNDAHYDDHDHHDHYDYDGEGSGGGFHTDTVDDHFNLYHGDDYHGDGPGGDGHDGEWDLCQDGEPPVDEDLKVGQAVSVQVDDRCWCATIMQKFGWCHFEVRYDGGDKDGVLETVPCERLRVVHQSILTAVIWWWIFFLLLSVIACVWAFCWFKPAKSDSTSPVVEY